MYVPLALVLVSTESGTVSGTVLVVATGMVSITYKWIFLEFVCKTKIK